MPPEGYTEYSAQSKREDTPESTLLLTIEVGDRTLAMAQRVVHHVAQVLAPDCAPLFVTDGFRESMTALLTHYGYWLQPPRRQGTAVTRLPTPEARQKAMLDALGTPFPPARSLHRR